MIASVLMVIVYKLIICFLSEGTSGSAMLTASEHLGGGTKDSPISSSLTSDQGAVVAVTGTRREASVPLTVRRESTETIERGAFGVPGAR